MGAGHHDTMTSVQAEDGTGETTDNVPLTDTQRTITIIVHYLAFVIGAIVIWAFLHKYDTLRNRLWSPFILLTGLVWLQIGSALEIGNHYYEGNWELSGFPTDLVNGTFYFFNFGAQYLNALGLRKKGLPFFRWPSSGSGGRWWHCLIDLTALVFDIIMVAAVFSTAPMYTALGRESASSIISAFGAMAGVGIVFRLWRNLGPNRWTLWGGILFLAFALVGVGMISAYQNTGVEWYHIFIGGMFVVSLIPFTVAILKAEDNLEDINDEEDQEVADSLIVSKAVVLSGDDRTPTFENESGEGSTDNV